MERARWLAERRAAVRDEYTQKWATYEFGPGTPVHRRFVSRLVATVPPGGSVLDAACGTARYAGIVLEAGLRYVGVDQSSGMLARAEADWPQGTFEPCGLQELAFETAFDAVMCIDAMEHVPPEDWPTVVAAFRRALRPGGHLYLTVEEVDPAEIDEAFAKASVEGLPTVHGEVIEGETAGYHYYPGRDRVDRWLDDARFELVEQEDELLEGYAYHHRLLRERDA